MSKYLRVLKQIDKRMIAKGYKLTSVTDGEEQIISAKHTKTELYEWATQCDMATMTYRTIEDNAKKVTFYLIYGNELEETIYDMGYNNEQASIDAEQVADEISEFYSKVNY